MRFYDFRKQLTFSTTSRGRPYEQIIRETLPGIVFVEKTDVAVDKTGIDYVGTLRRGAKINFDLKLRDRGCSHFWKHGEEELSLETWSVMPSEGRLGKAGWTLDEAKATHYTLHAFDPVDSSRIFLLPFQLLRKAFRGNVQEWRRIYDHAIQDSGLWKSECVFVPVSVVLSAIHEAVICRWKDAHV